MKCGEIFDLRYSYELKASEMSHFISHAGNVINFTSALFAESITETSECNKH